MHILYTYTYIYLAKRVYERYVWTSALYTHTHIQNNTHRQKLTSTIEPIKTETIYTHTQTVFAGHSFSIYVKVSSRCARGNINIVCIQAAET